MQLLLPKPPPGPRQELFAPQIRPAPRPGVERRRLLLERRRQRRGQGRDATAYARHGGVLPLGVGVSQRRGRLPGRGGPAAKEEPERGRVGVAVAELGFHDAVRGGRGVRWGGGRGRQLACVPPPAASEPGARARPPFYTASRHAGPLAPHASRPFACDWLEPSPGSALGAGVGREREGEGARTRLAAPPGACDWCARARGARGARPRGGG